MLRAWLLVGCLLVAPFARAAQRGTTVPARVVEATVVAPEQPIPRGQVFPLIVELHIQPTFHVNAHRVSDPFLIPTSIESRLPAGFRLLTVDYPEGEEKRFAFSPTPLQVYSGRVRIRLQIRAERQLRLGEHALAFLLHYQACNDTICLPPATQALSARLQVVASARRR